MIVIDQTSLQVVEDHLLHLGRGDHCDNMKRLQRFECHCSVSLAEEEFLGLVFLQNREVARIAPPGCNRTLRVVAQRAIDLGQPKLSGNWDLAGNLRQMREKLLSGSIYQEALVICEARGDGEERYGQWSLQDGSHRALAFATLMLLLDARYEPQKAYCSMSREIYQRLSRP
jgi:hypothetical protein